MSNSSRDVVFPDGKTGTISYVDGENVDKMLDTIATKTGQKWDAINKRTGMVIAPHTLLSDILSPIYLWMNNELSAAELRKQFGLTDEDLGKSQVATSSYHSHTLNGASDSSLTLSGDLSDQTLESAAEAIRGGKVNHLTLKGVLLTGEKADELAALIQDASATGLVSLSLEDCTIDKKGIDHIIQSSQARGIELTVKEAVSSDRLLSDEKLKEKLKEKPEENEESEESDEMPNEASGSLFAFRKVLSHRPRRRVGSSRPKSRSKAHSRHRSTRSPSRRRR